MVRQLREKRGRNISKLSRGNFFLIGCMKLALVAGGGPVWDSHNVLERNVLLGVHECFSLDSSIIHTKSAAKATGGKNQNLCAICKIWRPNDLLNAQTFHFTYIFGITVTRTVVFLQKVN